MDDNMDKSDSSDKDSQNSPSDDSITEQLASSASIENDRSFNEIEISHPPQIHSNGERNAKSILEEILQDDKFTSKEESFNLFANLSDGSLLNSLTNGKFELPLDDEEKTPQVRQLEEILAVKNSTISALNQELDSFRDTNSSLVSATEYKNFQEEYYAKLMEYDGAVKNRDKMIQDLTEGLTQSSEDRAELHRQIEGFKGEVAELQLKLQETSRMVQLHQCDDVVKLQTEIDNLKLRLKTEQEEYEAEIKRLRELLENIKCGSTELMEFREEIEKKHSKEVEELRTYFEKKCAELGKNYSDEIFSQHSRKLSNSSSDIELSGNYLLSSQPGPGGDQNGVFHSKKDVEDFLVGLSKLTEKLSKHNLDNVKDKGLRNIEIEVKNELNGLLKLGEKLEVKALEDKYAEEINNLRFQLEERKCPVQEVANSGDFELNEVVESYERRLQEQVALARLDIIEEITSQIQRLATNDLEEDEWSSDVMKIRDKFTGKYEVEIAQLQRDHQAEIDRIKEDNLKILNGALGRARRWSLRDGEEELVKDRDNLKRQVLSLRNLLSELVQYVSQAEDELNNTLVDNLIKQDLDEESNTSTTNSSRIFDSFSKNRVHLVPNFLDLINLIGEDPDESKDISVDLKNELGLCLEKLKNEANAVLALSSGRVTSPRGLDKLRKLELDKEFLQTRLEALEAESKKDKQKIAQLIENEFVSEGYGEEGVGGTLGDTLVALKTLQDQARALLAQTRIIDPEISRLIDELLRVSEKVREEGKRECTDLVQQIKVADKKFKQSQKFLDEQAMEREQERDEAQKRIDHLLEQLRNKDKDRITCQMMSNEAANLETQLSVAKTAINHLQARQKETQEERDEAIEKIKILREIIEKLEEQIDDKDKHIQEHLQRGEKLQSLLQEQLHHQCGDEEVRRHCADLEEEVQKLRATKEEGDLREILRQLSEIEASVEKKTKELEQHSTGTTRCSSPSEDMSVRDLVPQKSPNMDDCEVPLQQLCRLKEKLLRHSRAEEAAIKRICDLEMQLATLEGKLEEAQNEKEFMKSQLHEQYVLISDFEIRLNEQRIKAEHIEQQTNSSLESKIYDLEKLIGELREKIANKEKILGQKEEIIRLTQERLREVEQEVNSPKDDDVIVEMQRELDKLTQENRQLKDQSLNQNSEVMLLMEQTEQLSQLGLKPDETPLPEVSPIHKRRVHFEDNLSEKIEERDLKIHKLEEKLEEFQEKTEKWQERLKMMDDSLQQAANSFEEEHKKMDALLLEKQQLQGELDRVIEEKRVQVQQLEELQRKLTLSAESNYKLAQAVKDTSTEVNLWKTIAQDNSTVAKTQQATIASLNDELQAKQAELTDKTCHLEIANEDLQYHQNRVEELDVQVKKLDKFQKEIVQLRELLRDRDKVIEQMTEDHHALHQRLEIIDAKMKEGGNVYDLSTRLKNEQKKNADLYQEIHKLKADLLSYESAPVEEITGNVRNALECAAQIDSNILSAVSDQSLSSISEGQDVEGYRRSLRIQKSQNKQLLRQNDQLQKEKLNLEQHVNGLQQKLLEMQQNFDKHQVLSHQSKIEDAKLMEQLRIKLDNVLDHQELQQRFLDEEKHTRRMLEVQIEELKKPSSSESTKYKSLPTPESLELQHLKKEVALLKQEKNDYNQSVQKLQQSMSQLDVTLKFTQKQLQFEQERNKAQEDKVKVLNERIKNLYDEVLRKKYELEDKEHRVREWKVKMEELEQATRLLKQQKGQLLEELKSQTPMTNDVPRQMQALLKELEERTGELASRMGQIEQMEVEKRVLEGQLRSELRRNVDAGVPFEHLVARNEYLFAKNLRLMSTNKAVVYQKRFLASFLNSHHNYCRVDILPSYPHEDHCIRRRYSALWHFRSAVYVVIAIRRMQYMYKRWHSGVRYHEKVNGRHNTPQANFHVGKPVSNQNFVRQANSSNPFIEPWSGATPPSKERKRLTNDVTPLRAPQLLGQLHERVEQIQEKLSVPYLSS